MKVNCLYFIIAFFSVSFSAYTQSMQLKFCGKTSSVVPAKDNNGVDQRHKGGIRMDLLRIGKLSQSRTAPFYSLGIDPLSFANGTWVDGCTNNTNQTYCSGCTTCKSVMSTSNNVIGVVEGLMEANVRLRTNNNDLYIESTGSQDLVCLVTNSIDVSSYAGKLIEVNSIYEGTALDGFTTVNVNFNYRYNNGNWTNILNQNSNFLRLIDTAILIPVKVPSAVANLDGIVDFEISPNPATDHLNLELNSQKAFNGTMSIRDIIGKQISEQDVFIQQGQNKLNLNTQQLDGGLYLFQLSDRDGRISTRKFAKN